jgi:hypothetical protein
MRYNQVQNIWIMLKLCKDQSIIIDTTILRLGPKFSHREIVHEVATSNHTADTVAWDVAQH